MGTSIPSEPFEIDPAKTYTVTVDRWFWYPGEERCGGLYQGKFSGDVIGAGVIWWIDSNYECTDQTLLYPPLGGMAERIFSIKEI